MSSHERVLDRALVLSGTIGRIEAHLEFVERGMEKPETAIQKIREIVNESKEIQR
jgi:hypothetical protein